jgi:hypothetical protein
LARVCLEATGNKTGWHISMDLQILPYKSRRITTRKFLYTNYSVSRTQAQFSSSI